jgi:creatinine amidohydrolase
MRGPKQPYRYDHYTWVELKEIIPQQRVVVLPVGSTEDHGHHLPLDVDHFVVSEICEAAARLIPHEVLLLPTVSYGFEDHHMDFPGTITISDEHLLHFVLDITKSVAHHGFRKIIIVNGHGSNAPILELAARRTVTETEAHCGFVNAGAGVDTDAIAESELSSHAEEIETSTYLHLNPDVVQMDKATREVKVPITKYYWRGSVKGKGASPLRMMDIWSRISDSGVIGDATLGTAEKGKLFFEAAATALAELLVEFRTIPIEARVDHH